MRAGIVVNVTGVDCRQLEAIISDRGARPNAKLEFAVNRIEARALASASGPRQPFPRQL
jgi:hypothetical protein